MRVLPKAVVAAMLVSGCGDGSGNTTVTVTSPTVTTQAASPTPAKYTGEDGEIVITSPASDVETAEDSFTVAGKSTLSEVLITNVGGPNDIDHPDAGESGYPEYRISVAPDGSWSQRVAIFPGENSIFVEDTDETISEERTITGTGSAMPGSYRDDAGSAADDASAPDEVSDAEQELYDASAAVGLTRAASKVARYCVRKVGARIGREEPPSKALIRARDEYVPLVKRIIKNYPDIDVAGKSLGEFLDDQVAGLRRSDCDSRLAAAIEDAALTLEP